MDEIFLTKEMKQRAGHQEILGETLAKFEFFQHGWHPYSRFLDVDKIDLVLRRRREAQVEYREVQVKYGKLYRCTRPWELLLFSHSSWRFFTEKNLTDMTERGGLYLAYVLAPDEEEPMSEARSIFSSRDAGGTDRRLLSGNSSPVTPAAGPGNFCSADAEISFVFSAFCIGICC